ncbi:LysR family transcriptional regulator [Sphingopyxis sp.]|uniref:LysR family transcriptional regulator n=1 Tax=Sphingopyxis sp. TaxID=1908224 RepID=UPI002B48C6B7|nr:LysR family transcriptional regulator [Sphingopyxis sp.]HJS09756.1 LysR family transcriptional regulator [Sphingopyxis sp.]
MLAAFDAVARHLSFSAAADELQLTQSAVSRQIKVLEDQLGCLLFVRDRRKVMLSDAGAAYHREVKPILAALFRATLEITTNRAGGSLDLAILPTFGTRWLAPRLGHFLADNPGVTINLCTRLNVFDFHFESIDAAIHFGLPEWPGAGLDYLMGEQVIPVCSPALRREAGFAEPGDLLRAPLIHLVSRPRAWMNWFGSMQVRAGQIDGLMIDQFATAAQAVAGGVGVALMPTFLIAAELGRGELVPAVDVEPIAGEESYYLAWPKARTSHQPLAAFRAWLVEEATRFRSGAP